MGKVSLSDQFQPSFGLPWRPVLTREHVKDWDTERLARYIKIRKEVEAGAINNPVGQGWSLPMWDLVQKNWSKYKNIIILGGNRSSKSVFASRLSLWAAATIPEADVRLYHVNEDRSIQDQQAMIYEALPVGIKSLPTKKGVNHSLQFSQKNGFTDNICILPPLPAHRKGSQMVFGNYRQYQQDAQVIEGYKSHLIWCDEECPQKMFETLQYRTIDYHGRIILTFTTLTGWTPLIQDILGKTRTIEKRFAPLVGKELPIMQESLSRPGTVIYYFWTEDNAFIDTSDFIDKIKGRPKDEILARAYGIPTKSITGAFSAFNKDVNVIPHEKLPWLNLKKDKHGKDIPYKVTNYMAVDPAGSKPWFMIWLAVDASETWFVWAEWPDDDDWALPGNTAEGKAGPAQARGKRGYKDYIDIMKSVEANGEVFERIVDPRAGAAEKQTDDGAATIIYDMEELGITLIPAPVSRSGGSNSEIEVGIQKINDLLSWDETKPRDAMNSPRLFISDRCQNLIYAMSEYTGKAGSGENTKDPVDCLRYLCHADARYIDVRGVTDKMAYGTTGGY